MKKQTLLLSLFILLGFSKANCQSSQDWEWARCATQITGGGGEGINVASDNYNNLYFTGYYHSIRFDTSSLTGVGAYIAKYDSSGKLKWATGSLGGTFAEGFGICTDASGNCYIAGHFQDTISFGSYILPSAGSLDFFLTKYDSLGNVIWAKRYGGTGTEVCYSVAVDAKDNIYITGGFSSSAFAIGLDTLINTGQYDIFIAKYDSSGNVLWAKSVGGTNDEFGFAVTTDVSENVYITGYFVSPTLVFGSHSLANVGGHDVYIAKFDSLGNAIWAKSIGGTSLEQGNSITTDTLQNIYLTGQFASSSISIDSFTLINAGGYDAFLVKYDNEGVALWAKSIGGSGNESGFCVASDKYNNIYLSGGFTSSTVIIDTITLPFPSGGLDALFIAYYNTQGHAIFAKALASGGDDWNAVASITSGCVYIGSDFNINSLIVGNDTLTKTNIGEVPYVAKLCYPQIATNIPEFTNTKEFILYPNPLTSSSILQFNTQIKNFEVVIYDMVGKEMMRKKLSGNRMELEKGSLERGVYFVRISSDEGQWVNKMIIE